MALAVRCFTTTVVVVVFLVVTFCVSDQVEAQPKALTLSIDCGATKNYTDNATGIHWVPDTAYIKTGTTLKNRTVRNSLQYQTLRYFQEKQSKFCYELPATNDTSYLVRATFFNGGMISNSPSFQVLIDTSNVALIKPGNSSTWERVVEVIVFPTVAYIDVCLAPVSNGAFINSIELRKLAAKMYPIVRRGYMMVSSFRYDFGGNQAIRYPDDPYDRLWNQYNTGSADVTILNASQNVQVENAFTRDSAPVAVMNTAMSWPRGTEFTLPLQVNGSGRNYVLLLWFAELDNTVATEVPRELVVGINGKWQAPINVLNVTGNHFEAYEWGYNSVPLTSTSNLGLKATDASEVGPILNAIEAYELSDPVQPRTDTHDVVAINAIKQFWLNLRTWIGDPCLFLSYDWTSCSVDTKPRVTELNLAGYNLTGAIPADAIANLTELRTLSLANNSLNGSVPNLSALKILQKLHLQNNDFTGEFPAWVANLTNLQELFVEGNNLTGYVPASLFNRTGLKFTYTSGGLCTGVSSTAACTPLPEPPVPSPLAPPSSSKSSRKMAIIIGCVAGALGVIVLALIACLLRFKPSSLAASISSRQLLKADSEAGISCSSAKGQIMMAYSFTEVKNATNNFRNQISDGIFGPVYQGRLSYGREVAVKRCRPSNRLGFTEFFDQVEVLSRVHHTNLTSLLGFCQDEHEQILLHEYMSNSDLRTHLHGDGKHLQWSTRLAIALDIARGIEYLHTSCDPRIIHRDVRPTNILLTKNMVAKVSNFGLPKFTNEIDSKLQLAGYLDPEYAVSGYLTEKSDVYGFGVVLLELVSGQEPVVKPTSSDRTPLLIDWMRDLLATGDIKAVVDPRLGENYNLECMWKVAELGMTCVEPRPFNRPAMAEVVKELEDAIAVEDSQFQSPLSSPSSGGHL